MLDMPLARLLIGAWSVPANDSSIDRRFNFKLFAVIAESKIGQRFATTGTDLGILRQVDPIFTKK